MSVNFYLLFQSFIGLRLRFNIYIFYDFSANQKFGYRIRILVEFIIKRSMLNSRVSVSLISCGVIVL